MATATDEIYVKIITDVENATQGLMKLAEKVVATYLSFRTLKDIVIGSVQEYIKAEQAEMQLATALKITGQYSEVAMHNLKGMSEALMGTTVFSHEATQGAMALLAELGNLSENGIARAIPLLQDWAQAVGIDLNTAAEQFVRMLSGTSDSLGRFHLQIKAGLDPADRFNAILGAMKEKVGGVAEALAKTTGGQIEIFKNQIGELKETLGGWLANTFLPALENLNKAFERMAQDKEAALAISAFAAGTATASQKVIGLQAAIDDLSKEGVRLQGLLEISPGNVEAQKQLNIVMHQMTMDQVALQKAMKDAQDHAAAAPKTPFNNEDAAAKLAAYWADIASHMDDAYKAYVSGNFGMNPETAGLKGEAQDRSGTGPQNMLQGNWQQDGQYMAFIAQKAAQYNSELERTPADLAAIAQQSKDLAGQMQQIADAAIAFGTSIAKGDTAGAFEQLGMQLAKLLVTQALGAAATAAGFAQWGVMAFWLGVAGVGAIAEIGIGASQGNSSGNSGGSSLPHDISSSKNMNISVQISARDIARSVAQVQGNW